MVNMLISSLVRIASLESWNDSKSRDREIEGPLTRSLFASLCLRPYGLSSGKGSLRVQFRRARCFTWSLPADTFSSFFSSRFSIVSLGVRQDLVS